MPCRWRAAFAVLWLLLAGCQPLPPAQPPHAGDYLFCFWNVENLFDDQVDHYENKADQEYDAWFARDSDALQLKLKHLSEAVMQLNDGRGPDILAVAEVEGLRAAELLREALNRQVPDASLEYRHLLMKELHAGRHIAPAILTRLPVQRDRTHLLGARLRILEGHVTVNGHDLVILAGNWTSRVSDEHGEHRDKYADQIHGAVRGMCLSNPQVDLLVCGDFNDAPDAPSVTRHLRAIGDRETVLHPQEDPYLLNLFADKDANEGWGTHFYNGKWHIFDQIAIAPGLLDRKGWSCDPESVRTVHTPARPGDPRHRPWRFGNEHDHGPRGSSDHYPVTVRLQVHGDG